MQERIDPSKFDVRDLPPIWGLTVEQKWLVEGLIPADSLIMLSGESGGGKSTVALALAHAVSAGEPFLGRETMQKPVLIVDRENGLPVYHERLKRLNIPANKDLIFWGNWNDLQPGAPDEVAVKKFAAREKPVIIFDSFIAFHTGSEQDATETREYTELYRTLVGLGATVIIIHHTGKGENTKEYRGSSDIKGSLDVGITLIPKKPLLKLLQLKPFKTREGVLDPIMVTLDQDRFQEVSTEFIQPEDHDWVAVHSYIKLNPGKNQGDIVKALPGITFFKVRKILIAGETKGTLAVVKGQKNASFYYLAETQNGQ